MTKAPSHNLDVLVLGNHPSAYLAAALLKEKTKLQVALAELPATEPDDRLVILNPAIWDLHPLLAGMGKKLKTTPIHGIRFLADQSEVRSEHHTKSAVIGIVRYKDVREKLKKLAEIEGVEFLGARPIQIHRLDETGVDVTIGKKQLRPTALVVAGQLPADQQALLGMPEHWDPEVVHRFTILRCRNVRHLNLPVKSAMPMSLDLRGKLCWGWLFPGDDEFQIMVEQPADGQASPSTGPELLAHWIKVLQQHGVLADKFEFSPSSAISFDLPLAGALAHEGVANRTLLIGPAGGFYSACGEDIYPGCWSAVFAADILKKALKEPHLQDALNPYRQKWRTTLGDYLRGPHQNLRFLLPLVYRNPAMTSRLAEAILLSRSVVR
jgi:flavin-dependent dehydrogenase